MNQPINLSNIYRTQGVIVGFSALALGILQGTGVLISFLIGALVSTANFALLQLIWGRVLGKKPVATTAFIIVFKYAVLGFILYYFSKALGAQLVPLMVGFSTLFGTFVVVAVQALINR